MLGEREYSDVFESRRFNDHVANIKEECKDDPSMFRHLIENYHDEDYFSTDMDERVTQLVAFGYVGTTAMRNPVPSGTGSGSSESSVDAPAPFVDLTGGPLERAEKPPDLDRMVTMTDETVTAMDMMPETPQAEKTPVEETSTGSKKKKSKLRRKARREETAEPSTSTPRAPGPKETVLQEAMEEIAV